MNGKLPAYNLDTTAKIRKLIELLNGEKELMVYIIPFHMPGEDVYLYNPESAESGK